MDIIDNWNAVSIGTYQELCGVDYDNELSKSVQIISILTDTDSDTIRKIPLKEFYRLSESAKFISDLPINADVRRVIEIDGTEYGFINDLDLNVTLGEWMDIENWKDKSIDNMHYILALIYRPVVKRSGDDYTIEEYKAENFMRRAELFREKMTIESVYGAYLFFSLFAIEYIQSSLDYSEAGEKVTTKKSTKKTQTRRVTKKGK
jgi:hypothetical protein